MKKLIELLLIVFALIAAMGSSKAEGYEISPRDAAVGGFIAYFWCIQRTQGFEAAKKQWDTWNIVVNVQQAELESEKIKEISKIVYNNTGLSRNTVCPNASEATPREMESIQIEMNKLRLR